MYEGIKSMFVSMQDIGLVDVVLPLILAFAILYGIFQKTRVFGSDRGQPKSNVNAVVALAIALFVVVSINLVNLMTHIIWIFSILIIIAVMIMLLTGALGVKFSELFKKKRGGNEK
jgi:nitrate reductase NapE component